MSLLEEIKKLPSFANATDGNVVSLLKEQATKYEAQTEELQQLQAKYEKLQAREHESILATALAEGRITAEQKPMYQKLLESDRTSTEALLNSLPKAKNQGGGYPLAKAFTQTEIQGSESKYHGKTWQELERANLLADYKAHDPEGFSALYKREFGVDYQY